MLSLILLGHAGDLLPAQPGRPLARPWASVTTTWPPSPGMERVREGPQALKCHGTKAHPALGEQWLCLGPKRQELEGLHLLLGGGCPQCSCWPRTEWVTEIKCIFPPLEGALKNKGKGGLLLHWSC